jgi:2-keto-3-deoxy-L-arabinonate dehydratase
MCVDRFVEGDRGADFHFMIQDAPENRRCGLQACKVLMREGDVIRSDAVRHPIRFKNFIR